MPRYAWMSRMQAAPRGARGDTVRSEIEADQLLVASTQDQGKGDYPFYTERWMGDLSEREIPYDDGRATAQPTAEAPDQATMARVVVDAQLTRQQRTVVRWLAQGLSQQQIAEMLGVSEASVTRLKQAALNQIKRAAQEA